MTRRALFAVFLVCLTIAVQGSHPCKPENVYVVHPVEHYDRSVNGYGDHDAALTVNGRAQAESLSDTLQANHPNIGAVYVANRFYAQQTVADWLLGLGVIYPEDRAAMYIYDLDESHDVSTRLAAQDPCDEDVLVVAHDENYADVFDDLGFSGTIPTSSEFGVYGILYHFERDEDDEDLTTETFFANGGSDVPALPCDVLDIPVKYIPEGPF